MNNSYFLNNIGIKIKKKIKSFDFFFISKYFNYNYENGYGTTLGGIGSLLVIFFTLALLIFQVKNSIIDSA
jgi:hypothetical protein